METAGPAPAGPLASGVAQPASMPAPGGLVLSKFLLFETKARFYLVGHTKCGTQWRVLKIDRTERCELVLVEDSAVYSKQEVNALLHRIAQGNQACGGMRFVTKSYGLVGFVRFLESYYMVLITKRRLLGTVCNHQIFGVDETAIVTVQHPSVEGEEANSRAEKRYKRLLTSVMSNPALVKDFFFSYTYPLMRTVQANALGAQEPGVAAAGAVPLGEQPVSDAYESMFVWNAFLTRRVREMLGSGRWTVPLVQGYFQQTKLSVFGRVINLTLVSRRSRHFAGTRYLKRGVNDAGHVANDVETEQILEEEAVFSHGVHHFSSVVQNRGSIPLFWSQEASSLSPKPDIVLQRFDPVYEATRLHFGDLSARYGDPIVILNLIKTVEKHPRESILRREFVNAVSYINQLLPEERRLKYMHFDFAKHSKRAAGANVLASLSAIVKDALDNTGFFYSGRRDRRAAGGVSRSRSVDGGGQGLQGAPGLASSPPADREPRAPAAGDAPVVVVGGGSAVASGRTAPARGAVRLQSGVLRSNCVDCLDRTNVAQFAFGVCALGHQLQALGLTETAELDGDSDIVATLMGMYRRMGDVLAQQYGGSDAHSAVFDQRRGDWLAASQSKELVTSLRRYYSNNVTDAEKQDAINLFLGNFVPEPRKPALWELDSDYMLHTRAPPGSTGIPGLGRPVKAVEESATSSEPSSPEAGSPSAPAGPPAAPLPPPVQYTAASSCRQAAVSLAEEPCPASPNSEVATQPSLPQHQLELHQQQQQPPPPPPPPSQPLSRFARSWSMSSANIEGGGAVSAGSRLVHLGSICAPRPFSAAYRTDKLTSFDKITAVNTPTPMRMFAAKGPSPAPVSTLASSAAVQHPAMGAAASSLPASGAGISSPRVGALAAAASGSHIAGPEPFGQEEQPPSPFRGARAASAYLHQPSLRLNAWSFRPARRSVAGDATPPSPGASTAAVSAPLAVPRAASAATRSLSGALSSSASFSALGSVEAMQEQLLPTSGEESAYQRLLASRLGAGELGSDTLDSISEAYCKDGSAVADAAVLDLAGDAVADTYVAYAAVAAAAAVAAKEAVTAESLYAQVRNLIGAFQMPTDAPPPVAPPVGGPPSPGPPFSFEGYNPIIPAA